MNNEELSQKREAFRIRFQNETNKTKNRVHYHTASNFSDALLKIGNGTENELHKEKIHRYFEEVERLEVPIDKLESLILYQEYLHPIALYLMRKAQFRSAADFGRALMSGVILDFILFWAFSSSFGFFIPLFTIFFAVQGFIKNKSAKKGNRYFARSW